MTVEDRHFSASEIDQRADGSIVDVADDNEEIIVVAQADGEPVPLADEPTSSGSDIVIPSEIVPDADNVVELPSGVIIDDLQVDGADLVVVLGDGASIRIVGGALNIPTFVIDGIEVPSETVVAVLGENGINVAAGPEGLLSVVGPAPQGSGGNFEDGIGEEQDGGGPEVLGLLQNTSQGGDGTT
ncbi:hypothetical protein [Mesorhizobium sp. Z1-4]|uniref:hypothetical protein n=1 Tax=Mesorhizobium sp. Z1-4 TaxID=2448478 RepID=UPI000FD91156|nr:hypothetical protein [Mesorhizobium sp. Z1-4]